MKSKLLLILFFVSTITCLAQWSQINTGIFNLNSGARTLGNSSTCIFSAAADKMYKSLDQGINWIEIQTPIASHTPECGFSMGGNYIAGMNASVGCIYYTSDNGATWQSPSGAPSATVVRGFIALSGSIFAYCSNMGVYRSDDDGMTWNQKNTSLSNLNVIFMETINTKIIAATIGGGVFVSSDNGDSWTQSNSGIAGGDLNASLVWRMGGNLYYYAQGGGSYTSIDEGNTWVGWVKPSVMGLAPLEISRKYSNIYLRSRHFSGALVDSVFVSDNDGISWTNLTGNLPSNINGYGLLEFDNFLFTGFNLLSPGEGIYRRATLSTTIGKNTLDNNDNKILCYPNPFSDKLFIDNAGGNKFESVNIYNSMGHLVYSMDGSKSGAINTSQFVSGIYTIEILWADNTIIHRVIIK